MRRLKLCAALTGAVMSACSPALDWREVRPEGSGVVALFPCKPKSQTRTATLAGARVPMTLLSCEADGATFALSHADLGDPSQVTPALIELRTALAGNLGAGDVRSVAFDVTGMTPNPQAARVKLEGRLPDGTKRQEQAALFTRGTRVYQAVVLGPRVEDAAANVFFESLRPPS
jgi:hypothetical protein